MRLPSPHGIWRRAATDASLAGPSAARGQGDPRADGARRAAAAGARAADPRARGLASGAAGAHPRLDGVDHQHGRPRAHRRDVARARRAARRAEPDDVRLAVLVGRTALGRRRLRLAARRRGPEDRAAARAPAPRRAAVRAVRGRVRLPAADPVTGRLRGGRRRRDAPGRVPRPRRARHAGVDRTAVRGRLRVRPPRGGGRRRGVAVRAVGDAGAPGRRGRAGSPARATCCAASSRATTATSRTSSTAWCATPPCAARRATSRCRARSPTAWRRSSSRPQRSSRGAQRARRRTCTATTTTSASVTHRP